MAAGSTYTPIATNTLGSAAASYTFSSIPATYTDLVLIVNAKATSGGVGINIRLNGISASSYSSTLINGNGASAASARYTSATQFDAMNYNGAIPTTGFTVISNFFNYANTTTYKTSLTRYSAGDSEVTASVNLFRGSTGSSTEAINSIAIATGGTFAIGSTFTLYGIAAA